MSLGYLQVGIGNLFQQNGICQCVMLGSAIISHMFP